MKGRMSRLGDLQTTSTVQELQRKLYLKAKSDVKFRFYALYDKVYREDVLLEAWTQVRRNRGAAGIDGKSIEEIEREGVETLLGGIEEELKEKKYNPQPAKRVYIPKSDGKKRPLSIPTIKDRVIQAALRIVIEPIFEADFEDCSYGFRKGCSGQEAAQEVRKLLNTGYTKVIDTDIEDCFGSIPHQELLDMVAKRVVDGEILRLIKLFLKAGVMEGDDIRRDSKGTPQGGVISPLLANIYLNNLDKGWKPVNGSARLIRYADDIVIMTRSHVAGYKRHLEDILSGMKLRLKVSKTRIVEAEKETFDFLGYTFRKAASKRTGKQWAYWYPSAKAMKAIRRKIRATADHRRPVKVEQVVKELNPAIRGWVNYFRIANSAEKFGTVRRYATQRVRKFMRRRRQAKGYGYKRYPESYLYNTLGLYSDYRVCWTKVLK
jgi:RNA-directed DNA polymerase